MNDRYPSALMVSLTLHGAIAGLMFLSAYAASLSRPESSPYVELVMGEGDNFAATEAPALGSPEAIKLDLPPAPEPAPPREVAPPEPSPVVAAPPPPPVEKPLPKPVDFSNTITKKIDRAETKTKAAIEKNRVAEEKKLTKAEFDLRNKQKKVASAAPAGPPKVAKIDAAGIAKGVVGGSTKNQTGGAGGKALVRDDGPVMDAYFALLQTRLRAALNKPPGLSDTLETLVRVSLNADGSLTGAKITKSSGSAEFDAAVMAALASTQMPARPDNKSEALTIPFRMKEQ